MAGNAIQHISSFGVARQVHLAARTIMPTSFRSRSSRMARPGWLILEPTHIRRMRALAMNSGLLGPIIRLPWTSSNNRCRPGHFHGGHALRARLTLWCQITDSPAWAAHTMDTLPLRNLFGIKGACLYSGATTEQTPLCRATFL